MGGCVPHQIEGGQVFAPSCMASQQCSSTLAAGGKGCSKEKCCHKLEQSTKLCIRHTTPLQKKAFAHQKKKHKQTTPPPPPKLFFSFFGSFLLFPFFVLVFCFCVVSFFCGQKRAKDHEDSIFVLFLQHPTAHSTQHKAQGTEHRAHTHTHTHKYCIMKPSGPSWNTRLFRDK